MLGGQSWYTRVSRQCNSAGGKRTSIHDLVTGPRPRIGLIKAAASDKQEHYGGGQGKEVAHLSLLR